MSLNDFDALTPAEFSEALKAYRQQEEQADRSQWERMRMLACITIQPHVKKKLTPSQLLPLPWDADKQKPLTQKEQAERVRAARMAAEKARKRLEESATR